jgi:TRAP-type C4-dicarboxylate transport system permease small subunit
MIHTYETISILSFGVMLAAGVIMLHVLCPSALYGINKWMHRVILFFAEICLAAMVIIVIVTVILRYFFNTGIAWAEEVPRLLVGYFAFFACAMGVRDHTHITMNVFYNLAPKGGKVRACIDFFADFAVLICGLFMLYYGGARILLMMARSGALPITRWPNWVQYAAVPVVGFTILVDSLLFLTGVIKPNDLLFSEPDVDYAAQVIREKKKGGKK